MAYQGDKYVGDLALYYIAKKLESGTKSGSVKDIVDSNEIEKQLKGASDREPFAEIGNVKLYPILGPNANAKATQFNQDEISAAMNMADNLLGLPEKLDYTDSVAKFREMERNTAEVKKVEQKITQAVSPNEVTFDFAPNKPVEVVIKDSKGAKDPVYTGVTFDFAPNTDPAQVIAEAQLSANNNISTPTFPLSSEGAASEPIFKPEDAPIILPPTGDPLPGDPPPGDVLPPSGQSQEQVLSNEKNQFNNIPEGADLVDVEGQLFLRYAVPGAGSLYQGSTIFMFYEVKDNDPIEAGFVTPGENYFINAKFSYDDLDLMGVIAGNSADLPGNDPATGKAPHPFTSFAENLAKEATIQPWLLDPDSVALIAEAALEGREVTRAEWFSTNWYKTHNEAERSWLEEYTADPLTATQKANDYKLQVASALKAAGVSGGYDTDTNKELAAPDALSGWIANKWVTGEWSEAYTTEQLALFADPFRSGVRDAKFSEYIDSGGVGGLNRTAEQEDRVRSLYTQWLGPVFGSLTDAEVAEKAGRIRNNPDYEAALVESLKTSRLALFPKHTNTELTYDDIVSPYRGITRQIWGQEADETQGWWQDMVATNDYEASQTLLREKGLEQNIGQVTVEATKALQEALGGAAGSVETNLGVNQ
jgi:hypothetical protein